MFLSTPRKEWGEYPALTEALRLVNIDVDMPMRIYTDVACNNDEPLPKDKLLTDGLVNWQWEEGDELHLDGKVLWITCSARFYIDVYLRVNGVVKHYAMDNHLTDLSPAADVVRCKDYDTGEYRPQCHLCWKGEDHERMLESQNDTRMGWS